VRAPDRRARRRPKRKNKILSGSPVERSHLGGEKRRNRPDLPGRTQAPRQRTRKTKTESCALAGELGAEKSGDEK
jgi:hypothetical protein